jgi:Lrp/AsnC family transcriptional regulator of ectoine degradation
MSYKLNCTDLRILNTLQNNAKITNQDLADRVALAPSSCLQRVRRLEKEGMIKRYLAIVNQAKICRSISCIATVTMKHHAQKDFDKFESIVRDMPEVIECYTVSGGFDFILKVICTSMEQYLKINNDLLNSASNIDQISTHVVMNENKPFTGFPLDMLVEKPER